MEGETEERTAAPSCGLSGLYAFSHKPKSYKCERSGVPRLITSQAAPSSFGFDNCVLGCSLVPLGQSVPLSPAECIRPLVSVVQAPEYRAKFNWFAASEEI